MQRDLYTRCVRRVRGFLSPFWRGGTKALRRFVRRILLPFRNSPHILYELIRTPIKVATIAGLAFSLNAEPNLTPVSAQGAENGKQERSYQPTLIAQSEGPSKAFIDGAGSRKEIVFIDEGLHEPRRLAQAAREGTVIHFLKTDRSGIEQITEVLATQQDVGAVHLLSHGGPGYLNLGSDVVTRETLLYHEHTLRTWGETLAKDADILVYGCEVAGSPEGKTFLAEVGNLTGADVAGSDDLTGSAKLGGDWNLEYTRGLVDTVGLSPRPSEPYEAVLATITVDSAKDTVGADGEVTLREAIVAANTDAAYYDAPAGLGADTINFDAGLTGKTINLNNELPKIDDDLTITGLGSANLGIEGPYYGSDAIFEVSPATTVSISGLSIMDCFSSGRAGGICNYGDLTVSDCTLGGNTATQAGAIYNNGGNLTVNNCSFSSNYGQIGAGAIYNYEGVLSLEGCTIDYNSGYLSGAIFSGNPGVKKSRSLSASEATISNCIIMGNSTTSTWEDSSGAIQNYGGKMSIIKCAILQNDATSVRRLATGAIQNSGGYLKVTDSDILENSATSYYERAVGGISNEAVPGKIRVAQVGPGGMYAGEVELVNSTVSKNKANSPLWAETTGAIYNSGGFLKISDSEITENSAGSPNHPAVGGIVNVNRYSGIRPGVASPVPGPGGMYVGEVDLVNSTISKNKASSLSWQAVGAIFNEGGSLKSTDSDISENAGFTYYSRAVGGILNENVNSGIASDVDVGPGGIYVGEVDLVNSTVSKNGAMGGRGSTTGGIANSGGDLSISGGGVADNKGYSDQGVGGISNYQGRGMRPAPLAAPRDVYGKATAEITNCAIVGNIGPRGGGMRNDYGSAVTIDSSTLSGNYGNRGGGINSECYGGSLSITNSTISGNSSAYEGGGILHVFGPLTIRNSTVANNLAGVSGPGYAGGGLYVEKAFVPLPVSRKAPPPPTADIESTLMAGNTDTAAAPDISDADGVLTARNSLVQDPGGHPVVDGVDNNLVGVDPQLQPLADNGGPTMTHEIPLTSPAIDTGSNPLTLATDQRGEARESRGGADIGAYERQNVPPTIISAVADPNPTQVGQTVTFTADATDADNDTLTYAWDFGDGSTGTGPTATHAYAALGTYTVTVTVSDGFGSVSTTLTVIIEAEESVAGVGPDTDGDGFSDSLEEFLGTTPTDPGSTPWDIGAIGEAPLNFVKKLKISLNFKPTVVGKDRIRLLAEVPVPEGFQWEGQEVVVDIGGVQKRFVLDRRRRGQDGNVRVSFSRPKLGFSRMVLARKFVGDYQDILAASSGLNNADVDNQARTVRVTILWNDQPLVSNENVPYKAKLDKKGVANKRVNNP